MLEEIPTTQAASEFVTAEFLPGLMAFDPVYIGATLAVFGVLLIFLLMLFKVRSWVVLLVKKLLLLGIVVALGYLTLSNLPEKLSVDGLQQAPITNVILALVGGVFFLIALVISLSSLFSHSKKRSEPEQVASVPPIQPTTIRQPQMFTTQALKAQITNDRSLLAVIGYVIIAEFGIFSSPTMSAPNPNVGMLFFGVFFVGAFIFIKTSYKKYLKGVAHLFIATIFAVGLSVFLGHLWAEIPLEVLLSIGYFGTNALVAVVTGIAVSLLMGSKG